MIDSPALSLPGLSRQSMTTDSAQTFDGGVHGCPQPVRA
jgi:hypothetical protein